MQFNYGPAVAEQEERCCRRGGIRCWRHFVTSVEMHNFEDSYEKTSVKDFLIKKSQDKLMSILFAFNELRRRRRRTEWFSSGGILIFQNAILYTY